MSQMRFPANGLPSTGVRPISAPDARPGPVGLPESSYAISSGVTLTPKGERYAQRGEGNHLPFADWRRGIEDEIERLLTILDQVDDVDAEDDELGDVGWPEQFGPRALKADAIDDDAEDGGDLEPSLGSINPSAGCWVVPLGFWQVKPHYLSEDEWADRLRNRGSIAYHVASGWAVGSTCDAEGDEHDGREPVNEDGPSWQERICQTNLGYDCAEDCEPSLGRTENVDQVRGNILADMWMVDDGEINEQAAR